MKALAGNPLLRRALFGLVLTVVCFVGLGRSLWTPDEPREAEISREMYLHPTVIPTLDAARFYEKPPLYYWTVAAIFALAGGPTIAGARAVSAAAGLLTLLVIYLWGSRAVSRRAGAAAALMLATSVTFFMTTHWVLIDPLLMLFCALAAWGGWELVARRGRFGFAALYLGLAAALWTKGLVGPVLIGGGLAVDAFFQRRDGVWRRLRPLAGLSVLAVALLALVAAIFLEGGREALWQWAWVNHVERFVKPQGTYHDQPVYYYASALPVALLPWLVPFLDLFTKSYWAAAAPTARLRRYCASLCGVGLLVLTASATKRENYLLPLLAPLFVMMSLAVVDRLAQPARLPALGWWRVGEWIQAAFSALVVLLPGVAAILYAREAVPPALVMIALALPLAVGLLVATAQRRRGLAAALAGISGVVLVVGGLAVTRSVLEPQKDFTPFVRYVDRTLPSGSPVDTIGADETLSGIVPFLSGRRVIDHEPRAFAAPGEPAALPSFLLVQRKRGRPDAVPGLEAHYRPLRTFGQGRVLTLWQLRQP